MTPARVAGTTALLLAAGVSACSAQQPPSSMVISSDRALVELASELLPNLVARSGLELREPVRLERRSREELVRYLEAKLDEELPEAEARSTVEVYALLGLVQPDLDLRSVLLALYTEQVAGFYEPDSTALFVMDDQPDAALEGLLVHELVHAIQDQNADLGALTDRDLGNDRAIAAQAAIEGHATLVMLEFMTEQMAGVPIDLSEIPDFAAQMRPILESMRSQFPALAGAPRIIQESLLFPYLEGTGFVQSLWARGERVAPFGPELPPSTEQVIARGTANEPVELELTVSGGRAVREDVLGRLEIGVLLEEHGAGDAEIADGWDGDRYVLVELPDGTRGLGWYALWEDEPARARFLTAMQAVVSRLGTHASIDGLEVAGHLATVLHVANVGEITARIRASDRP